MRRAVIGILLTPLSAAGQYASAAENGPNVVLSCDGTLTPTRGEAKPAGPQPVQNMAVVVNLDERTVSFMGYVTHINDVDTANISFGSKQIGGLDLDYSIAIRGDLDRATGHMDATTTTFDSTKQPYDPNTVVIRYEVLCKVTTRVF
jgi:hypothetical protein